MIRVSLPAHLRTIAGVKTEVELEVDGAATQRSVLDALEQRYPALRGTIRDHTTGQRRPFIRVFACEQDLSHESPDAPLPDAVASGAEPLLVVGAIAGGSDRNPLPRRRRSVNQRRYRAATVREFPWRSAPPMSMKVAFATRSD